MDAAEAVKLAVDRSLAVPPGRRVVTGYVPIHRIRLACRDRMAVGDVEKAHRQQLQLGSYQAWPPPRGYWEGGDVFVIEDGRHAMVAALMIGIEHLFVAWLENTNA
jgi:hypothetical protein